MNDPKKTILGTGDFALIIGASAAPADEDDYDLAANDFGNVSNVALSNESTLVEHMGSYKGLKIRDDAVITGLKNGFTLTVDEFSEQAFRGMFLAGAGVDDSDDSTYTKYIPVSAANTLKGYGRLRIHKAGESEPRIIWKNFECIVRASSMPNFDGDNHASLELEVTVLADLGEVLVKKTA